jgi:hypothetical protein
MSRKDTIYIDSNTVAYSLDDVKKIIRGSINDSKVTTQVDAQPLRTDKSREKGEPIADREKQQV